VLEEGREGGREGRREGGREGLGVYLWEERREEMQ